MKKLMSAVVALAAGVAMATDGVTSANVVGYVNDTIDQFGGNSSLIAPQFIGTGTDGVIELQSIKCPETAYDQISIQQLYGDGSGKKMYVWKRKWDKDAKKFNFGWMDNEDQSKFAEGVTFEPGEAFWTQNDGEEGANTFNTSGQVNANDVVYPLAFGGDSILCGNAFPQQVPLQEILCPETAYDKITLMTLNGDGSGKKLYVWKRKWDKDAKKFNFGWMDNEDQSKFAEGVSFKAGQGFWVQCDGTEEDAFTITFPGVEL